MLFILYQRFDYLGYISQAIVKSETLKLLLLKEEEGVLLWAFVLVN